MASGICSGCSFQHWAMVWPSFLHPEQTTSFVRCPASGSTFVEAGETGSASLGLGQFLAMCPSFWHLWHLLFSSMLGSPIRLPSRFLRSTLSPSRSVIGLFGLGSPPPSVATCSDASLVRGSVDRAGGISPHLRISASWAMMFISTSLAMAIISCRVEGSSPLMCYCHLEIPFLHMFSCVRRLECACATPMPDHVQW